jgi:hypothetical protein
LEVEYFGSDFFMTAGFENGVGMTASEGLADRTWWDLLRAHTLLRAGVATIDRVLGGSNKSNTDPQVTMELTETSHATYRALVKLTEVREMLVDLSAEHPRQRP